MDAQNQLMQNCHGKAPWNMCALGGTQGFKVLCGEGHSAWVDRSPEVCIRVPERLLKDLKVCRMNKKRAVHGGQGREGFKAEKWVEPCLEVRPLGKRRPSRKRFCFCPAGQHLHLLSPTFWLLLLQKEPQSENAHQPVRVRPSTQCGETRATSERRRGCRA